MAAERQPRAEPMLSQLAEPAARTVAWGGLALFAVGLAIATVRNLLGGD